MSSHILRYSEHDLIYFRKLLLVYGYETNFGDAVSDAQNLIKFQIPLPFCNTYGCVMPKKEYNYAAFFFIIDMFEDLMRKFQNILCFVDSVVSHMYSQSRPR